MNRELLQKAIVEICEQWNDIKDRLEERKKAIIKFDKYWDETAIDNGKDFQDVILGDTGVASVKQSMSGLKDSFGKQLTDSSFCEQLSKKWGDIRKKLDGELISSLVTIAKDSEEDSKTKSIAVESLENVIKAINEISSLYANQIAPLFPNGKISIISNRFLATRYPNMLTAIANPPDLDCVLDYFDFEYTKKSKSAGFWLPNNILLRYEIEKVVNSFPDKKDLFKCASEPISDGDVQQYISMLGWKLVEYVRNDIDIYVERLRRNKNIVLSGAPGTGKTYLAKQIAARMIFGKGNDDLQSRYVQVNLSNSQQFKFVQFHPSYDYTDFVEGLRPVKNENSTFNRQDGVFKAFCKVAKAHEAEYKKDDKSNEFTYVFVIDEINRGDMSKIFGELFFSIDPGYRGVDGIVQTQYQNLIDKDGNDLFKDGFYVPENVFIIGTMNDIDRSVESLDFAMRRRFAFYEISPDIRVNMLTKRKDECAERMQSLNNAISEIEGLSSSYHIGPAYFKKIEESKTFEALWKFHLEGLLKEYLRGMPDADTKLKSLKNAYDLRS